jgi:hypothetical protein
MTPDDVAEIRAAHTAMTNPDALALCDALTAAWAERDEHIEAGGQWLKMERERAERAEAAWHEEGEAHTETLAALARVRALCGMAALDYGVASFQADILAAIEGP